MINPRLTNLGQILAKVAIRAMEESDAVSEAYNECLDAGYQIHLTLEVSFDETPEAEDIELKRIFDLVDPRSEKEKQ